MHIFVDRSLSSNDSLALYVKDLEHPQAEYEEIVISLEGLSKTVLINTSGERDSTAATFIGLSPNTAYEATGYVKRYGEEQKEVFGAAFVTQEPSYHVPQNNIYASGALVDEATKMSAEVTSNEYTTLSELTEYYPTFYPGVQHQWVNAGDDYAVMQAGSCVANSLSIMKTIQHFRKTGRPIPFHCWWIYGNRTPGDWFGEGMYPEQALYKLVQDGVLEAEYGSDNLMFQDFFYNTKKFKGAFNTVQDAYTSNIADTRDNRISTYAKVYTSNPKAVQDSVIANGVAQVFFKIWNDFYYVTKPGIVPKYTSFNGENHQMAIIGWKTIDGVPHWICQNSWGTGWGEYGICYLPFNHPCIIEYYTVKDNPVVPKPVKGLIGIKTALDNEIKLDWDTAIDNKVCTVSYRVKGGTEWITHGTTKLSVYTVKPLNPFVAYEFKVQPNNLYGDGEARYLVGDAAIRITPAVGSISNLVLEARNTPTGVDLYMSFNAAKYAVGYEYKVYMDDLLIKSPALYYGGTEIKNHSIEKGLPEGKTYKVEVTPVKLTEEPTLTFTGPTTTVSVFAKDITPPKVDIIRVRNTNFGISVTWEALDTGSGLYVGTEENPAYKVYISEPDSDGEKLYNVANTNNQNYIFTTGPNGSALVPNATYYVSVSAKDNVGHESDTFGTRKSIVFTTKLSSGLPGGIS